MAFGIIVEIWGVIIFYSSWYWFVIHGRGIMGSYFNAFPSCACFVFLFSNFASLYLLWLRWRIIGMATNCFATPTTLTLYVMRPTLVCANWVSAYPSHGFCHLKMHDWHFQASHTQPWIQSHMLDYKMTSTFWAWEVDMPSIGLSPMPHAHPTKISTSRSLSHFQSHMGQHETTST